MNNIITLQNHYTGQIIIRKIKNRSYIFGLFPEQRNARFVTK